LSLLINDRTFVIERIRYFSLWLAAGQTQK